MQYLYGDKMQLRVLDEIEFWKQQEMEHTMVIRTIAPGLEPDYVKAMEQWELALGRTQGLAVRYIESLARTGSEGAKGFSDETLSLTYFAVKQSEHFIAVLDHLVANSTAIKGNPVAKVVVAHIRRESEYFIGVAQTVLE